MNKFLFVLIVLFLIAAILDQISLMSSRSYLSSGVNPLRIAELFAILLMLYNGTFRTTKFYSVFRIALLCLTLGITFKILHYSGADELLLVSFSTIAIIYSIHFVMKKNKVLIDYFKVSLVVVFFSMVPLTVLHLISDDVKGVLLLVSHVLCWITFALFLYEEGYRKKALF